MTDRTVDLDDTRPLGGRGDERVLRFSALARGAVFAGRYEIRQRLGSGGSGEVLRAFDLTAAADVAIKVLYPSGEDPRVALERLRRELQIVRGLAHDGIVRVHDIGEHDGLLYLVMDFLEGETLAARLHRGPLELDEARRVLDQLLAALAAAHAKGIVHRDIKPANIFLAGGRAVLLDFGLARRPGDRSLTVAGAVVGTPEYASPEQAAGRETGPAGDLYSLGVVLCEMLAGRRTEEDDASEPAVRSAPAALRDLLRWMLEADPARRPRDGAEALAFLRSGRRRTLRHRLTDAAVRRLRRAGPARVGLAAVAAAGLLAAALVPARELRAEWNAIEVRSVAGVPLHRLPVPGTLVGTTPLDRWRHLVLMRHRPADAGGGTYPFVLDTLDTRTGRLRPLPIVVSVARLPQTTFPAFSADYAGKDLRPLSLRDPMRNRPMYAVTFSHEFEYPNLLLVIDDTGAGLLQLLAAGSISSPMVVPPALTEPSNFVVAVEQHDLDQRPSVVAVPFGAPTPLPLQSGTAVLSPGLDAYSGSARPAWVTFFSSGRIPSARLDAGSLVVLADQATELGRLDPRTGAPAGLAGAARDRWLQNQRDLVGLLDAGTSGSAADRAAAFERYAGRAGLDASQRGVALGRAADAWRRAGDLDRALAAAEEAAATEPGLLGHIRRLVDLYDLRGDWPAIARLKERHAADRVGQWAEWRREIAIAEILHGQHRLVLESRGVRNSYVEFVTAAARIDLGEYDAAAEDFATNPNSVCDTNPEVAFLAAMAETLRAQFHPERAQALLEIVRKGRGAGRHPPRELLEMVLAARTLGTHATPAAGVTRGKAAPTSADVERHLARHREAARHDIIDRLYARWAERRAAALAGGGEGAAAGGAAAGGGSSPPARRPRP